MTTLNRSQCHGLDLDRHLIMDAGAGTGKTTVMSIRYIEHILCEDQRASRILPKGPREPVSGQGALRVPRRQQQELDEWNGLLPPECVAITFTVKAAAELKEKIRSILSSLASAPDGESSSTVDPRLRKQGFVEQLTSLLDSAPIGTIDSFLSRLVAPHMSLIKEIPVSQTMAEEEGPLLNDAAINLLWCLQSELDALDAGLVGDVLGMLQARDRLAASMGGRKTAGTIIKGLIKQSLFVEEAEKVWQRRLRRNENDAARSVEDMLLSMVPDVVELSEAIHEHGLAWLDIVRSQFEALELSAGLSEDTRTRALDELLNAGPGEDAWHRLLWCHHVLITMASVTQYSAVRPNVLPRGLTPKGNQNGGWPEGIGKWNSIAAGIRNEIKEDAAEQAECIRSLLSTPTGNRLRTVARAAALHDDSVLPNPAPTGTKMNPDVLEEIPISAPKENPRLGSNLQIDMMQDLFIVLRAVDMIRVQMKRHSGMHDHSDMQRMAEDLLLARCPDICRSWYPRAMVSALDDLTNEPWMDHHIEQALMAGEDEKAKTDLQMRWQLLRNIRRRFRAFIIDEFQDTNPQQWRLLARLWGRRHLEPGEPEAPSGPWDPTICLVGDVKQSIYRFRQAQVTVMRNAISTIRGINREEGLNEHRIQDIHSNEVSRDPRPPEGGSGVHSTFVQADRFEPTKYEQKYSWWRFDLEDDGSISNHDVAEARAQGHIDLSTNHRTDEGLLQTINILCDDVFSERHHGLEGPWYAYPQPLRPHHIDKRGSLEWLLPVPRAADDPGSDLNEVLDPFSSPRAKGAHLENEMIARRLYCLINGISTRISSPQEEGSTWVQLPTMERVAPEDIMVLLPTRTHIDDLMKRLEAWRIPSTADKMGPLLQRPATRALRTLVGAISNPSRTDLVISLARSSLLGWQDALVSQTFAASTTEPFQALIRNARTEMERRLLERWYQHSLNGDLLRAVEDAVNHSDLLLTWSEPSARNEIEMFINILRGMVSSNGGNAVRIHERLEKLSALGKDGPAAKAPALGGCVRLMTIHAAKGLQAKVVVIAGLFQAGRRSVANTTRDHLIVTPELIAGRVKPWKTGKLSPHGLWMLAESLLEAQSEAETRRLLYVSMTRVKSHLILVGSPGTVSQNQSGAIQVQHKPGSRRNMGTMWLDALRAAAISTQQENSPWLIKPVDDSLAFPVDGSPDRTLFLNPASLRSDSGIGVANGPRLTLYHDPDCFMIEGVEARSLLQQVRIHEQGLANNSANPRVRGVMKRRRRIRLAPSSVDTAATCLRRHWLESHHGWPSEPLGSIHIETAVHGLPDPATLGTLFHRLVEVGLPNPVIELKETPPLPRDWTIASAQRMLDDSVLKQVIEEYSTPDIDVVETEERMRILSGLLIGGELGQACITGEYRGWKVEGLRTEMPFDLGLCTARNLALSSWTPSGSKTIADIETVIASMTGRIDLVLALGKDDGSSAYLVVDLKTRGCGGKFNVTDPDSGDPLQTVSGTEKMSVAEQELLQEHRMQLALYALALESQELAKPEEQRRTILPPALYVAANGRLVSEEGSIALEREKLIELLSILSLMKVTEISEDIVERLSGSAAEACRSCPHYRGRVRLCGPKGQVLGKVSES